MESVKVSAFIDIADPWSYIAATRLHRAAATVTIVTGEAIEVRYRAFPRPRRHDGGTPIAEAQDLGYDIAAVVSAARKTGIDLNMEDAVVSDSFDALRLMTWAEGHGGAQAQAELVRELWRAHFLEGADIGDHFVLATRAGLVGFNIERVEEFLAGSDLTDDVALQAQAVMQAGLEHPPAVVVESQWAIPDVETQDGYVQALHRIHREIAES